MNAIILCGGLSTRLGDIAKSVPKILLPIKNRSVLSYQIQKLKEIGINEVILAAGHLAEELYDQVGDELDGIKLLYSIEKEKLGTGGAIKQAKSLIKNEEPTIVLNGDVLTAANLNEMLKNLKKESDGIILGSAVEDASNYGTLYFDDDFHLLEFKEKEGLTKKGYINGGIYLFNSSAFNYFPSEKNFSIEYDVFPKIKNLYVYSSDDLWVDIGVPERLKWARDNWIQ